MGLVRTEDPDLAVVQRRGFCHFASTAERGQQLPNPEVGCVSVIGTTFQYWNGTAWVAFP
jgi:hypothetical protein